MAIKKYNQLFEARIDQTLPKDYIDDITRKGRASYGNGVSQADMMEMGRLGHQIMTAQRGNEARLTEIGIRILKEHYPILDTVNLDAKIVGFNDEEKRDMTDRAINGNDEEESQDDGGSDESYMEVDEMEVKRRKINNTIMQGEAQNVHSMLYEAKPEIDTINASLIQNYLNFIELNKKFDWWDRVDLAEAMTGDPSMSNMMETDYEDEDEEGNVTPTIKVRVLDLVMLLHETVKGIYELIAAKAIPEDSVMANAVLSQTDDLKNEQEDIRYGSYIAADIRDYINGLLDRKHPQGINLPSIREWIFSRMMEISATDFVELITAIVSVEDKTRADIMMRRFKIVENAIKDAKGETEQQAYNDDESEFELPATPSVKSLPSNNKEKSYKGMGQNELIFHLNAAIDAEDFETAKEIQKFLK